MPKYNVTDPETGRNLVLEGDSPPTEAELNDVFAAAKPSPQPPAEEGYQFGPFAKLPTPGPTPEFQTPEKYQEAVDFWKDKPAPPSVAGAAQSAYQFVNKNLVRLQPTGKEIMEGARQFTAAGAYSTPERLGIPEATPDQLANAEKSKAFKIVTGAVQGVGELEEFFTSPLGIATLGTGSLPAAAQKAIAVAFTAQMASQIPDQAKSLIAEIRKPEAERDYREIARQTVGGIGTLGFTTAGALHAAAHPDAGEMLGEPSQARDARLERSTVGAEPLPEKRNLFPFAPPAEVQGIPAPGTPVALAAPDRPLRPRVRPTQPFVPPEPGPLGVIPPLTERPTDETENKEKINEAGPLPLVQRLTTEPPAAGQAQVGATQPQGQNQAPTELESSPPVREPGTPSAAGPNVQSETVVTPGGTPAPVEPGKIPGNIVLTPVLKVGDARLEGRSHLEAAKSAPDDLRADALIAFSDDANHIFKDQNGKEYTREEAAKVFDEQRGNPPGKTKALHSEDLRDAGLLGHLAEPDTKDPEMPPEDQTQGKPMTARGAMGEYYINKRIIDTGLHPDGKKAKKSFIEELKERQKQVVQNYKNAMSDGGNPPAPPASPESKPPVATAPTDISKHLDVPIADVSEASTRVKAVERRQRELRSDADRIQTEIKALEKTIKPQRGNPYTRSKIKKSAKASDVARYRELQVQYNNIGEQLSALDDTVKDDRRTVEQSEDAAIVSDKNQPLLRRLDRRVRMLGDKAPPELVKARIDETERVIREKYPDATPEEISRLTPEVQRASFFGGDIWKSRELPNLYDIRRSALDAALESPDVPKHLFSEELKDKLNRFTAKDRAYSPTPSPIEDLSASQLADLKSEIRAASGKIQADLKAEAERHEEEQRAESIKLAQLTEEAQKIADSAPRTGTPGGRSAKEVKADLVSRIKGVLDEMLGKSDVTLKEGEKGEYVASSASSGVTAFGSIEPSGKSSFKVTVKRIAGDSVTLTVPTEEEARWVIKAMASEGAGKAVIGVPGDGVFRLNRSGESLVKLWKDARGIETSSGGSSYKASGGAERPPSSIKTERDWKDAKEYHGLEPLDKIYDWSPALRVVAEKVNPEHPEAVTTLDVDGWLNRKKEGKSADASEQPPPSDVGPGVSNREKAEQLAKSLDKLKSGLKGGTSGQMHAFGVIPAIWDRAVTIAQAAIRAGGTIADAVEAAIRYIKDSFNGQWDEAGARKALAESKADEPTSIPPQSELPGPDESSGKTSRHQVAGVRKLGAEYQPENISKQTAFVRQNLFDSTRDVSTATTDEAWSFYHQMTGRDKVDNARMVAMMGGGEMAPGVLKNELWDYAVKMSARGDPSLLRSMVDNYHEFQSIGGGEGAESEAGRVLRAAKDRAESPLWKASVLFAKQLAIAAGKKLGVGPDLFNEIVSSLQSLNVPLDELNRIVSEGKDSTGKTAEDYLREAALPEDDFILKLISRVPLPPLPAELTIRTVDLAKRIMDQFPLMNMRAKLAESGAQQLESDWWQLMSTEPKSPEGHVYTANKVLQAELGNILREVLIKEGVLPQNRPPQLTDFEKLAMTMGKGELRRNKVELVDQKVREAIASQMKDALDKAEDDPAAVDAIERRADQLIDIWDKASSALISEPASDRLFRRMVHGEMKAQKIDFNHAFDSNQDLNRVKKDVVDSLVKKTQDAATNQLDMADVRRVFEGTFDALRRTARNRWEMNQVAKRAREAMRLSDTAERSAQSIVARYAREQSDTPPDVQRKIKQADVQTAFNGYLSGDITASEFRATLKNINVSSNTIENLVKIADREIANRQVIEYFQRQDSQQRRRAVKEASDAQEAQRQAVRYMEQIEKRRGAEWIKPEARPTITKVIAEFLRPKGGVPPSIVEGTFSRELSNRLVEAGVEKWTADRIATSVYQQEAARQTTQGFKEMGRAADSNNLNSLVEHIMATPYRAQHDPAWRQRVAMDWFMSNGVSRDRAQAAAELFSQKFDEAFTAAAEREAGRLLAKGKAGPDSIREVIKAIRLGLTDPDKPWAEEIAKRSGFKSLTREQHAQVAKLDAELNNPALSPQEFANINEQMRTIFVHAGTHEGTFMRAVGEGFVMSLLSGVRTLTLHEFIPMMMAVRDLPHMAAADPRNAWNFSKAIYTAYRKVLASETKYAWQHDAYGFALASMDREYNTLKRVFDEAEQKYQTGSAGQKVTARLTQLYASQHYVAKILNTVVQSTMAATREWKLAYYSSIALREAGLSTKMIGDLMDTMALARQTDFEQAMDEGLDANTARVRANYLQTRAVEAWVTDKTKSAALGREVLEAAERDVYSMQGRKAPGIKEEDEGGLSRFGMNQFIRAYGDIRREGGPSSIFATSMFGFVSIPYRVMRFMSNYHYYGLVRYGIDRWRVNHGKDTLWKQSYGNALQARARFREALTGSILTTLAAAWAYGNTTSDDKAGKEGFGLYITGGGPTNKTLRDAYDKAGWKRYSLNFVVDGRKVVVPLTRAGVALMFPFMIPAGMDDAAWKKKEFAATGRGDKFGVSNEVGALIGAHFYMSGQHGILQSVEAFSRATEGGSGALKAIVKVAAAATSASVLPYKQMLASLSDMFVGPIDQSSMTSVIASNFPLVGLPFQTRGVNRFGDELYDQSWFGKINRTGIPVSFQVSQNPENKALYEDLLLQKGAAPPALMRSSIQERYGPLTDEQWQKFTRLSGKNLKETVTGGLDGLKLTDPEEVKKFLTRAATDANDEAASALGLERIKDTAKAALDGGPAPAESLSLPKPPQLPKIGAQAGEAGAPAPRTAPGGSKTPYKRSGVRGVSNHRVSLSGSRASHGRSIRPRLARRGGTGRIRLHRARTRKIRVHLV